METRHGLVIPPEDFGDAPRGGVTPTERLRMADQVVAYLLARGDRAPLADGPPPMTLNQIQRSRAVVD